MFDIEEVDTVKIDTRTQFMTDVDRGLSHPNKYLLSKYFYDKKGSEIFNAITKQDFYYLTRAESAILDQHKSTISKYIAMLTPFNLVELGPGEGIKTQILIKHFLHQQLNFTYIPIDISTKYLTDIYFDKVPVKPINADYLSGLKWHKQHNTAKNLLLFLGSSIGNFDTHATIKFLKELNHALNPGDYVLIGFDLVKEKSILLRAYDDMLGLTKAFNLNLLSRINYELNGDFDLANFKHTARFNEKNHAMESYLISTKQQKVAIGELQKNYSFYKDEAIHMEYSFKYTFDKIAEFAKASNFKIIENLCDKNEYFVDSLWQVC